MKLMTLQCALPEDAVRCIQTLSAYGQEDILGFMAEYESLKTWIAASLEIYSRLPVWLSKDVVFRSVMRSLDRVLSVLDSKVGELFPHYFHPITDEDILGERIVNIDARLRQNYGQLGKSHRIWWWYSLACRVEKYTRYKDISTTLYRSPGAMQIIRDTLGSLAAMGIR